jgi:hypothetical protein
MPEPGHREIEEAPHFERQQTLARVDEMHRKRVRLELAQHQDKAALRDRLPPVPRRASADA